MADATPLGELAPLTDRHGKPVFAGLAEATR